MTYLVTAVLGLLLVIATVLGIIAANNHGQRPSAGSQDRSGVVLYGSR